MVWIVLGCIGFPIWLIAGVLAALLWNRRHFKKQPGVFPAKLRLESGSFHGLSGDKILYLSFRLDDGSILQMSDIGENEALAQGPFLTGKEPED
jgi:hypothetical protein